MYNCFIFFSKATDVTTEEQPVVETTTAQVFSQ